MDHNTYLPRLAKIIHIKEEVSGTRPIKTFRAQFLQENGFSYRCGQCAMLSVFGKGESMISISSSPLVNDYLQFSILKMGRVTSALHEMQVDDIIGIRGPYGNSFPIEKWKGKNLIFIGGGIGLAPIWSVLNTALGKKQDYGKLTLFYGARTSNDLVFKEELEELRQDLTVHLSIDVEEPEWNDYVGFVPLNVLDKKPSPKNAISITCGPPIMIKFVIQNLQALGFKDEQIFTTVENKMKCGIGKCGRCNIGLHYVCKDGPVYSWAELKNLPQEY
ncbi:MAG: FAD/NAD(P)-binding protein [Candidatus Aminicenantes bacterium]|jgi:sulfhydrogenase subunit gamma (sulfur reductase)|nr:FAD/NAD(P)-binding protein [Candidatus Aminicenantes bacterium]MDH5383991.1 FAD/NAD(P)-binding protein [Candidatus Aminicenantes bacterium]MDH5742778.1 FAD/NAD(P)-binding protein [Candidatus Aminicenantes bacterium]